MANADWSDILAFSAVGVPVIRSGKVARAC